MKPDPIYAAIEASRTAKKALLASVCRYNALERRFGPAPDVEKTPHPDVKKWEVEWAACSTQDDRAMRRLCRTRPTTPEGIAAVTAYLIDVWNTLNAPRVEVEAPDGYLELLLRSLSEAAAAIAKRQTTGRVVPFKKAA